jgi:outer membrane protein OmpA-like peptidoglycan-associated protein
MRRALTACSLIASLSLAPALAAADTPDDDPGPGPSGMQLELGVWMGAFFADDEHEFYDHPAAVHQPLRRPAPDLGARIGFYPLAALGFEVEAGMALAETDDTGDQVDLLALRGQVVLQLPARVTPFVLAGFENFYTTSDVLGTDRDTDWHVGLGAKLFATDRLQLRVDGRLYRSNRLRDGADDNGDINHYGVTAGLAWTLGGGRKAPPADRDGDGVPDASDECPEEVGPAPTGCPAPTDSDGDGILDDVDRCPTEPETVNGHEDTDGCPDELPDPDGDGLRGAADQCPDQPEDVDGFQDEDGCPDPDNDGDGLLDTADACPDEAGPAENRGCPDLDRDGDGVVDRLDNCPDEAGTAENQGCKSKQLVVITQNQLKILDRVYFKTGKAELDRRSFKLLDNIASVLKAHPEIARIRIEGHTDDQGPDDKNKELSQKRAEAVAVYLVNKGVELERLEPVGFGEEKPIADNKTRAGKAENRRVEFNIVSDAAGAPAPGGDGGTLTPDF